MNRQIQDLPEIEATDKERDWKWEKERSRLRPRFWLKHSLERSHHLNWLGFGAAVLCLGYSGDTPMW